MAPGTPREWPSSSQVQGYDGEAKQLRRKALCRSRQVRYRMKQRQYEVALAVSVTALKSEIKELQATHHELRFAIWRNRVSVRPARTAEQALVETSHAYLQCFQHGFSTSARGPWIPSASTTDNSRADSVEVAGVAQIKFVEMHFQANVAHGILHGRNALLEQWRRYATCFASFEMKPSSLKVVHRSGQTFCQIRSHMVMRITPTTLEQIMPHVQRRSSIAAKLLTKPLTLDAIVELGCRDHGKIDVCETNVSVVDGFRALLGEYVAVAFVLDGAFISATGQLGRDLFEPARCLRRQPPRVESKCAAPCRQRSPVAVDEIAPLNAPSGDLRLDLAYILAPLS